MTATRAAPAVQAAGAASPDVLDWQAIDWRRVHQTGRRLQVRRVQARPEGRGGHGRAFPPRLTHACRAKAVAVRRVTEHHGPRTAGGDHVTWRPPAQNTTAIGTLRHRGDRPPPGRRVSVATSQGNLRGWGMPTMRDRALQALSLRALDPMAETRADPNACGCRTPRAPADAIAPGCLARAQTASPPGVCAGDIRAGVDERRPDGRWAPSPLAHASLHQWRQAGDRAGNVRHPTAAGTPPGGIGSPVIAKLAWAGREARLRTAVPRDGGNGHTPVCPQVTGSRRADAVGITGAPTARLEAAVKPRGAAGLQARGLDRAPEQTVITHLAAGWDVRAPHLRTYHGQRRITPSAKRLTLGLRTVRAVIQGPQRAAAGRLIGQVHPIIRGWVM